MLSPFEDDKLKRLKFNKFKAYGVRHSDGYESKDNNIIYTYHNDEENKDVYMVALRDDDGTLIGYYEKHEYRNRETTGLYDFKKN